MKYCFSFSAWFACLWLLASPSLAQVSINEFMADNKKSLQDEDGQSSDWIELYNAGSTQVNLAGWALTDDPTHQAKWLLPSTNITAKGFLVVFASAKNRGIVGAPLHTDFSLRASGEYLALLKPDGSLSTEFNPYPPQYPDFSYGISQNVTTNSLVGAGATGRMWVPTTFTPAWMAANYNDSGWTKATAGIGYETAVAGFAVYNYIANVGVCSLQAASDLINNPAQQQAVYSENPSVINSVNTGSGSHFGNDQTFPGLVMNQDQDNFAILATATVSIPAAGNWTFGVNSDDGFQLTVGGQVMSYPSPRGPDDTLQTFNFPAPGLYDLELVFYECGGGSEVELFAAQGAYGAFDGSAFHLVGDTANGGLAVTAPVVGSGSGAASYRSLIKTDVEAQMKDVNASIYLRFPFSVATPASVESLFLRMRYDDGFVAYLNGAEVARRNSPSTPVWNSVAAAAHPNDQARVFEDINLSAKTGSLVAGTNLLAIQAMNVAPGDVDFLVASELVEYRALNTVLRYFAIGTPGAYNGEGFGAFVADTKFSVDRGFFTNAFSLSITSATPLVTIIYTTNGSVPSVTNGYVYSAPLTIRGTTVLRAAGFRDGFYPSGVDTETYIFPADVIHQSPNGQVPPGWPSSWGANTVDYGMDPNIVNNAAYSGEMIADLKSIPTFSIVTDLKNLFDPATGIYANPGGDGMDWERPGSVELIYPDGTKGFQIDAGLRIRGGYSRSGGNPKHAFRFFFRQEYGQSKLKYPLFAKQNGTDTFDGFDLRTFQNYSWSFEGDYRFIGLRDQFSRDAQIAQGHNGERGDFYHLYIDGQYWGLYNTDERPEASYAQSYFGGNKEDYDVIKVDTGAGYTIFATDGNMDAWTRLWRAAVKGFVNDADYFKVQGLNVDGSPNPAYENLLEVDNLIDYMLVILFAGNIDAPISEFLGNNNPNNMYCIRNRTGLYGGFQFFSHDAEHTLHHESTLSITELTRNRLGPFAAGDPTQQGDAGALAHSNPQYLFSRLTANAEFRLRLADHIQKQFFNGGVFTTEGCRARFMVRSNEIYGAVAAESARWGDSKREPPRNRNVVWATEMNRVYGDYFGKRPGIVLGQFRAATPKLFPAVVAPAFSQYGGNIAPGYALTITSAVATVYYTRDGSDPRLRGGAVSPAAVVYAGPIPLNQSALVKARVLNNGVWSPLTEASFYVVQTFTNLLLTEILYHPLGVTNYNADDFEFVELKNVASTNLELSGLSFTNGIDYTFPMGTFLAPGKFLVLVASPSGFTNRYPSVHWDGVYSGRLSNSGERLTLVHAGGVPLFSVNYGTSFPWPPAADGQGFSIAPVNPNYNPDPANALNWRASSVIGGSPGADDPSLDLPRIVINEALTHTDPPTLDSVELYNPHATNANIGFWYLTDDRSLPRKYQFPRNTTVPANGYYVITENLWNADPLSTNSFRLDSHGEEIYLYSADTNGNLTGYSDGFAFGAAQNGVSFGRFVNSVGEVQYPAQRGNSPGQTNIGPRIGPVVINEIMYHPAAGGVEFIELKSITNTPVKLYDQDFPTNTWRLNGVGFNFPMDKEIAAKGLALVVAGDPVAFRSQYGVPAEVQIFGPYPGSLQGGGETISLQYPDHPDLNLTSGKIVVPYIDMDVVHYDNRAPWSTNADGSGSSLERIIASAYGNDPINWRSSSGPPSPGMANSGNRAPVVSAGADESLEISSVPFAFQLNPTVSDDGLPNPPGHLRVTWSFVSGPAPVWFANPGEKNTTAYFPGVGSYILRLTANDGKLSASSDLRVSLGRATSAVTLISKGSIWKYLDNGSEQGTDWYGVSFNDSAWPSGPAPLGYGDYDGNFPATTNSFGPDPSTKYITTYYRRSFNVSNPGSVTNLFLAVQRDDGVLVHINGTPVYTNNLPTTSAIHYLTPALTAVGGLDEATFYSQMVDPAVLRAGNNIVAAEIHQADGASSDIIFDLQLSGEGYPPNQAPVASVRSDQTIVLGTTANLAGTATDDGLPIPPGVILFNWSKVSGPGVVAFSSPNALQTTASFSAVGSYVLRFSATDGLAATTDDVSIAVTWDQVPPEIISAGFSDTPNQEFTLVFTALAGQVYRVEYCEVLNSGSWLKLADVPAQPLTQLVEVADPVTAGSTARFYRIVAPR